jgi:heme-degrading monooxygenase HmoA
MNAAALAQMKLVSGSVAELVQGVSESVKSQRFPGHNETMIYQPIQNIRQEVFVLSFWESRAAIPAFKPLYERRIDKNTRVSASLESLRTFQMVKDYRRVSVNIANSYIRLMALPVEEQTEQKIRRMALTYVEWARKVEGVIGMWFGRDDGQASSSDKQLHLLIRADWASMEAQEAYHHSSKLKELVAYHAAEGIIFEYDTGRLHSFITRGGEKEEGTTTN